LHSFSAFTHQWCRLWLNEVKTKLEKS
jgi:hypothetical protein